MCSTDKPEVVDASLYPVRIVVVKGTWRFTSEKVVFHSEMVPTSLRKDHDLGELEHVTTPVQIVRMSSQNEYLLLFRHI